MEAVQKKGNERWVERVKGKEDETCKPKLREMWGRRTKKKLNGNMERKAKQNENASK